MGDVGSARYEPALLAPCLTIRVLSYSKCQEIHLLHLYVNIQKLSTLRVKISYFPQLPIVYAQYITMGTYCIAISILISGVSNDLCDLKIMSLYCTIPANIKKKNFRCIIIKINIFFILTGTHISWVNIGTSWNKFALHYDKWVTMESKPQTYRSWVCCPNHLPINS